MVDAQELELIRRCQSGEQRAQEELILAVQDTVYYHCKKMLRNPERAMDATQEVLITLLTRLHTLRDPKAFWGWLLQIVANRCRNKLSRAPREEQIPENEQGDSMLESVAELNSQMVPEQALDQAETQQMIRTLVEELPPSQKMCVLLYYYDELPVRQIAAILQVSENTVKSRLSYARKSIQNGVEDYEKQGVKLYSAAPLPLLLAFLRHEGAASALPAAQAKALAATVVSASSGGQPLLQGRQEPLQELPQALPERGQWPPQAQPPVLRSKWRPAFWQRPWQLAESPWQCGIGSPIRRRLWPRKSRRRTPWKHRLPRMLRCRKFLSLRTRNPRRYRTGNRKNATSRCCGSPTISSSR